MKKLALFLFLASQVVLAGPAYTLQQICAKYSDDGVNCQRIPFCEAQRIPAMPAGCHAIPGYEHLENACVNIAPSMCIPLTTGCQMYGASKGQVLCRANRDGL